MLTKTGTAILLITVVLIPVSASAIVIDNPLEYESLEELIDHIISFLFYVGIALVPLLVLIGAFYILTAGGDPNRVQKGQKVIMYAIVGLVVILFARGIIAIIRHILGQSS